MNFALTRDEIASLCRTQPAFLERVLDRLFELEKRHNPNDSLTNNLKEYVIRNFHAGLKIEAIKHVRGYIDAHGQSLYREGIIKEINPPSQSSNGKFSIGLADAKRLVETWLSEKV